MAVKAVEAPVHSADICAQIEFPRQFLLGKKIEVHTPPLVADVDVLVTHMVVSHGTIERQCGGFEWLPAGIHTQAPRARLAYVVVSVVDDAVIVDKLIRGEQIVAERISQRGIKHDFRLH